MKELFSAFGVDWRLLVAQAINFALVLVVLRLFLYKPVLAMLAKRQEMVTKSVEDAVQAREMLSDADGEAAKRVAAADKEAESIVSAAREIGNAEKTRLLKEAEARAVALAADAEARARETALRLARESEQDITRLALLAAEKVLKKQYD